MSRGASRAAVVFATLVLAACGGTGDGGSAPVTYAIGGSVSGMSGSGLVLRNGSSDALAISSNGTFTFSGRVTSGAAYSVTVDQQPTDPTLNCNVMNAGRKGVVQSANVTDVSVVCTAVAQLAYAGYVNTQPTLVVLRINPQTGTLTLVPGSQIQVSTASVFTHGAGGRYAYGLQGGGIAGYAIDNASGTLATLASGPYGVGAVPPAPICVSSPPGICFDAVPTASQLAVDPLGQHLYAYYSQFYEPALPGVLAVSDIVAFSIDPPTGALTQVPVPGIGFTFAAGAEGMEIEPLGRFLYSGAVPDVHSGGPGGVEHYIIDAMTGALTESGGEPAAWPLSFEPEGKFAYGAPNPQGGAGQAYAIDSTNGALTHIGSDVAAPGLNTLVVDPAGAFAYGGCTGGMCAFSLDPSNGPLTALPGSPFATSAALSSLVFDPSGRFLICICGSAICVYALDPATGVPKLAPEGPFALGGVSFESVGILN
jgi:6-phosphogluconolactonase